MANFLFFFYLNIKRYLNKKKIATIIRFNTLNTNYISCPNCPKRRFLGLSFFVEIFLRGLKETPAGKVTTNVNFFFYPLIPQPQIGLL